ncbi:hypothetical protein KJ688_08725, partial [bacterium]|nr:hypothetical protein [bacterium]
MNNESYNLDDEFETICIDILSKSPIYVSNMLIDLYGFLPDVFRGSILKIVGFSSAILHFSNWSEYLQILSEYDVIEIINKSIGILCDRWNNIDYDSIHSIHGDEWDKMVSHSVNPSIIQDYKKIRMDSLTVP